MSTAESLRYDAAVEAAYAPLAECPECGHKSIIVTESYPATRQDPACSAGYCVCREGECCPCRYEWG